ncbi:MFS transporter [Actinopolymorpha pittospori]|uniref:MFS family permease n=1 Tax=Actinopolymorpha pittospori TaxID=648752 RepID=A0A927N1U0_9ACTN|nr:MFS family permease [Actinopolymorpha pittospori]
MSERHVGTRHRAADGHPPRPRRPVALAVFFALVGFAPANWLVRVPDVKAQVEASASQLGLVLLCGSIGGLAAVTVAGRVCLRFGTRRVMVVASAGLCAALVLPGLVTSVPALGASLALIGVMQSTFNIALNSSAVEIAAASGNPMMPTLHGIYSVGGLVGAAVGGFASERLTPVLHLSITAGLGLLVTLVFGTSMLRAERASAATGVESGTSANTRPAVGPWRSIRWIVLGFGVIAACTAYSEYANNNWATLHLREDLGATAAVAGYGFACYSCAIAGGRFLGSRLIRRLGDTTVLTGGFLLAAVGVLIAGWAAHLPGGLALAFAGYIVLGLGLANIFPIAISRGGALGGPRGVSRVSMVSTVGTLSQAPVIGFLTDRHSLPLALSSVAVLAVIAAALALGLRRWSQSATADPDAHPTEAADSDRTGPSHGPGDTAPAGAPTPTGVPTVLPRSNAVPPPSEGRKP